MTTPTNNNDADSRYPRGVDAVGVSVGGVGPHRRKAVEPVSHRWATLITRHVRVGEDRHTDAKEWRGDGRREVKRCLPGPVAQASVQATAHRHRASPRTPNSSMRTCLQASVAGAVRRSSPSMHCLPQQVQQWPIFPCDAFWMPPRWRRENARCAHDDGHRSHTVHGAGCGVL